MSKEDTSLIPYVIFEDEQLLVLDKPAGLLTHGTGREPSDYSLADWVGEQYPALAGVGEELGGDGERNVKRPGIVHRLDRETSGLLLIAKNQSAYLELKGKFKQHEIEKEYLAIVHGEVKRQAGVIDLPIGRSRRDPRRRVASPSAYGHLRPAVTHYQLLKNFKLFSYLSVKPQTGRTHQIRVHLKALNHPVAGDRLYAPGLPTAPGLPRLALHAHRLTLTAFGREYNLESPLSPDWVSTLDRLALLC